MSQIHVDRVTLGERHRKDMGDLEALASSIKDIGLLQPIVVDRNLRLIAGARRLAAVRLLGWQFIEAREVKGLDEALPALRAERDENTCRKDFTPSEFVAVGAALEELERPRAEERERSGKPVDPRDPGPEGRVRDIVGAALGVSGRTYSRAKAVVDASENPADPAHEEAKALREQMDAGTMTIRTADDTLKNTRRRKATREIVGGADRSRAGVLARRDNLRRLAAEGHNVSQIAKLLGITEPGVRRIASEHGIELTADKVLRGLKRLDSNRIVEGTVASVRDIGSSILEHVDYGELDPTLIDEWVDSLAGAIRSLTTLKRKLNQTRESTRASA